MKTSQKGIDFIKSYETLQLKAYKAVPSEQYYTIGYGHYGPDVKKGSSITESQAESLLAEDLASFEKAVNDSVVGLGLAQNQFDALVSFTFNVGVNAFKGSTLLRKIKAKASEGEIRMEFAKWKKSGGQTLPGLLKRRLAEADIYFKSYKS